MAGPSRYLEMVMQLCCTERTKTPYNQTLFKMPGGYVRKVPNMQLPVVLSLGIMDSIDSPRNKV